MVLGRFLSDLSERRYKAQTRRWFGNVGALCCPKVLAGARVDLVSCPDNSWIACCSLSCFENAGYLDPEAGFRHVSHLLDGDPSLYEAVRMPAQTYAVRLGKAWQFFHDSECNDAEIEDDDLISISEDRSNVFVGRQILTISERSGRLVDRRSASGMRFTAFWFDAERAKAFATDRALTGYAVAQMPFEDFKIRAREQGLRFSYCDPPGGRYESVAIL